MKLLTIELENFRQFYGKQEVEFAPGSVDGRNITVFHGFNGAGKTALLNAFIWCLYNETTPDLESPERLVNERAFAETAIGNVVHCRVALTFEYRGETFRAERTADQTKTGQSESSRPKAGLLLTKTSSGGETETVGRDDAVRQQRIEQILPKSLYPFFFFNGERVERLAAADAFESVEAGVKTLLDIEVYERGAARLRGPVTKALAEEAKRAGDSKLSEAVELLEQKAKEQTELKAENQELDGNTRALEREIESLERALEQLKDVAQAANERAKLRAQEKEEKETLSKRTKELASLLSKSGYLAFALVALDATEEQVAAARKRGDIPAKIKPQFVDDLLNERVCVCGRPIGKGSPEEDRLLNWRASTGLAELEEHIAHVHADLRVLRDRREQMFASVDTALKAMTQQRKRLADLHAEISAISERIAEGDFGEQAARLQDTIKARTNEIIRTKAAVLRNNQRISELDSEIEDIRKRTAKLETQSERAALAKRQLEAVQRVADALTKIRDIQKEDVRLALDEQIRDIWQDAAIKDYDAAVSSNYQLMLTKLVGGQRQQVNGASTGEKQVLALSFVGALVRKARENVGREHGMETGGYFPLVMDSPFGSLEDDYRRKVAVWLPTLAHQVVVMASKSQWRYEVESAMRPRIGREYVLELHSPKRGSERSISLEGKEYEYVVHNDDAVEMTIIRRIH
jgi:DNA sulfur modification protein DndD